ncbi:heavy-metal-associated domain-containing protein [Alsobacter sp. SYSU M60028]|uniref:Heavy-metal-associated domain-containing protein n=1 Tax=Alsobacter ponti TaxID=2962936 RepID=A0ABT1LCF2_9HYPH|nr:heavy-metal-associated domain-containing protein [Alsobacter ponti]MCP8939182.1 heavy-metal-associated domain-containing protein [Alsobacter ponti]
MSQTREPVVLKVEGMTCGGCANAVTRIVKRADPEADVKVELESGRVEARTTADIHKLAESITKAGYAATPLA